MRDYETGRNKLEATLNKEDRRKGILKYLENFNTGGEWKKWDERWQKFEDIIEAVFKIPDKELTTEVSEMYSQDFLDLIHLGYIETERWGVSHFEISVFRVTQRGLQLSLFEHQR